MLKRISGFSKSMIAKTRSALGGNPASTDVQRGGKSQYSEPQPLPEPLIVASSDHPVSGKVISANANKVLRRINQEGFSAYLVGGGVRDALVGLKPKDFDVATDASPEEVRALFRNSRIIGRRFRLVHVVFGRDIIEVATFRASHDKGDGGEVGKSGRIVRDNVYGSIEEDALRRDFSVNALYYNIADKTIVDYVGGLEDIDNRLFRLIGDPVTRCEEDPVRVLRAVRLAAKLDFDIEPATLDAMQSTAHALEHTPPARMFEEVLKLFQGGYALRSFKAICDHQLLQYLFPLLAKRFDDDTSVHQAELSEGADTGANTNTESDVYGAGSKAAFEKMLNEALANTDKRVAQEKPITPAYLLAFMLWPDVEERAKRFAESGMPITESLKKASDEVMSEQLKVISIPKRFSGPMREIWQLQPRLEQWRGGRSLKLMENRRFRAAYDFLCLRSSIDPRLQQLADWWTQVQELDEEGQSQAAQSKPVVFGIWSKDKKPQSKKRRPRRNNNRKRRSPAANNSQAKHDKQGD